MILEIFVEPVVIKINSSFLRYQDEYYRGEWLLSYS